MKKVGFILVVGLLAIVGVFAVMSYSAAVIESTAQIKIVSTDEALLSLRPGTDDYVDKLCTLDGDGCLSLSFSLTPDTSIAFEKLFFVQNNSADKITFTLENAGEEIEYLYLKPDWPTDSLPPVDSSMIFNGANQNIYYSLDPGEEVSIGVGFDVPHETSKTSYNGILQVKAEATR